MTAPTDDLRWLEQARHPDLTLLLDLDGTLVSFAATPEQAELDAEGASLLRELVASGIHVVVVSGRPQPLVERERMRLPGAWWIAEHGTWRHFGTRWEGPSAASEPVLDALVDSLRRCVHTSGVRYETKSTSFGVHWRLVPQPLRESTITAVELACDEWLETHRDYERLDGVEMLEIRHRSTHKGNAVREVREQRPDSVFIALGDDDTDEDMFAALGVNDLAVWVRNGRRRASRAQFSLPDPGAVRELLWWIVDARRREGLLPLPRFEQPSAPHAAVRSQLVVVSNRLPAAPTADRQRQVGGLVSALEPALREHEGIWLGWSGRTRDGQPVLTVEDDVIPRRAAFDFTPAWREHFYGGFCNRALWPLLHGFPGRVRYRDPDWQAYQDANRTFAEHAGRLVADGGTIWVHDYHLLLVARELRRAGYRGSIGLFMHVPFPHHDSFDTLPWADELFDAMRDFDLIGFHTEQWAANFRACAQNHDARRGERRPWPHIAVMPIGIDASAFASSHDGLENDVAGLVRALGQRRLILGVDRLDYSKGIPERLAAFEQLLERFPEWRGQVAFVQVSVPSREDIPEYAELRTEVERYVGRINGRFGEANWVPVRYLYRSYDHRVLAQLYRAADVALVTPLRDGLNLVAKEFIAAQDPARPGVLILSRFAGAAAELSQALITNPFHPGGVAVDLDRALRMPLAERQQRHAALSAVVTSSTPRTWANGFLVQLAARLAP